MRQLSVYYRSRALLANGTIFFPGPFFLLLSWQPHNLAEKPFFDTVQSLPLTHSMARLRANGRCQRAAKKRTNKNIGRRLRLPAVRKGRNHGHRLANLTGKLAECLLRTPSCHLVATPVPNGFLHSFCLQCSPTGLEQ